MVPARLREDGHALRGCWNNHRVRNLGYKRLCLHRHKEKVLQWLENSTTNVTDTEPSHTGQSSETKSRLST